MTTFLSRFSLVQREKEKRKEGSIYRYHREKKGKGRPLNDRAIERQGFPDPAASQRKGGNVCGQGGVDADADKEGRGKKTHRVA